MSLKSKLTKKKAKAKKSDRSKLKGKTFLIKPDGSRTEIPEVSPEKLSREEQFLERWQDLIDSGIEIDDSDIPEDMLDVWYDFEEDIKPKLAEKNWALWSAIFLPLILPSYVQGVTGKVELPPDAIKPSVMPQAPKPEKVADYARDYFQNHGLELCKTLSETDLKNLKQQMVANWGKGEDFFKDSFQEDYTDSKARLDTIYRTEYVIAQNEGMMARAKDAGHKFKVWNCALDERSCPECSALHGTSIPFDEEFPSEEGGLMRPPRHPNCRCVITSLTEDDYDQEGVREDAAYLNGASNFIKLNYKCKSGTVDDSNKCGDSDKNVQENGETFNSFKYGHDSFHEYPAKVADSKLIKYNNNISNYSENIRISGMRLVHRTGDNNRQDEARNQIKTEIISGTQLGKYLQDKIIAETRAFEEKPVTLYRAGKYNQDIIESYTTNPSGAFTSTFDDQPPGNDFHMEWSQLKNDGWQILNGVLQDARYPEEYEVTLINMKKLGLQKQDTAYLDVVNDFIKLNYNCPASEKQGEGPGSCSNKSSAISMYDLPKKHSGLEFYSSLYKIDSDINDVIRQKVEDSSDYNLFSTLSDKWLRNVDTEAREDAIKIVEQNKVLRSYLLHESFGLELPKSLKLYRVGPIKPYSTNSFFVNKESAESYQKRMGIHSIDSYEVSIQDVIPSLSGSGEVWVPGDNESLKQDSDYLNDVTDFIKLNYKCPENPPGSGNFTCNNDNNTSKNIEYNKLTLLEEKNRNKRNIIKNKLNQIRNSYKSIIESSDAFKQSNKNIVDKKILIKQLENNLINKYGFLPNEQDLDYVKDKEILHNEYSELNKLKATLDNIRNNEITKLENNPKTQKIINLHKKLSNINSDLNDQILQHRKKDSTAKQQIINSIKNIDLSERELSILTGYSGSSKATAYNQLSSDLPTKYTKEEEQELIQESNELENIINKFKLPEQTKVLKGLNEETKNILSSLGAFEIGNEFNYSGFISTTFSKNVADQFATYNNNGKKILAEFILPKGTPAAYIDTISKYKHEDELLVNRNLDFVCDDIIEDSKSKTYIFKSINNIKQDSAYLNDVTDFIKLNYKCPENPPGSDNFTCPDKQETPISKVSKAASIIQDVPYKGSQAELEISDNMKKDVAQKLKNRLVPTKPTIFNIIPEYNKLLEKTNALILSGKTIHGIPQNEYKDALLYYSDNSRDLNRLLLSTNDQDRKSIALYNEETKYFNKYINILDSLAEQSKTEVPITLFSGISKEVYDFIPKNNKSFNIKTYISSTPSEEVSQRFANVAEDRQSLRNLDQPTNDKYVLEINTKPGTQAIALENWTKNVYGNEKTLYSDPEHPNRTYVINEDYSENPIRLEDWYKDIHPPDGQHEVILGRKNSYKFINEYKKDGYTYVVIEANNNEIQQDSAYLNDVAMHFNQSSIVDPTFPVIAMGMCLDGTKILGNWYSGHTVKYAYKVNPAPGHAWVFVDGEPIDSYYGRMPRTYEWMHPDKMFDSWDELNKYQQQSTVTWRWTPTNQDQAYLNDVASYIKLNYKCKKEDSPDGSNKCPETAKSSKSDKILDIKVTVPAGIVPPGTTAAEIGTKFTQPNGAPIRGTVIAANDIRIPNTLYHFTTHGDAVARSGKLLAGGVGGLGGDRRDQIVSMTTDPEIAYALKNDMIFAAKYGKAVTENPPPPREWNSEKKVWEGDRTEWFNTVVAPLLIQKATEDGFSKFDPHNDALMVPESYGPDDHLRSYFHSRESSNREQGKETPAKFKNPRIYTETSELAKIDPNDIKVVTIPKKNLDQGQLLTDFDLDNPFGLKEIRSYGDIPLETPVKLNTNVAYLDDVSEFIKQNYKCEFNGTDFKCDLPEPTNNDSKNLSTDDKSVLNYYTSYGYGKINSYLRDKTNHKGNNTPQELETTKQAVSKLETIIAKNKLSKPLTVFKGVSRVTFKEYGMPEVGKVFTDNGFCSTSTDLKIATQHANSGNAGALIKGGPSKGIIMRYTLPEGTEAVIIPTSEQEILVQHGTQFKITSIQKDKKYWTVDAEVVTNPNRNILNNNNQAINWMETKSFSKLLSDWKTGTFISTDEDLELKELIKEQAFDKKPKVVSENELNQIISSGNTELYRGFSNEQTIEQFKNGEYYIGKGLYGNGTYATNNSDTAKLYGANISHMALDKSAKVISEEKLIQEQQSFVDSLDSQKRYTPEYADADEKISLLIHLATDNGRFATLKGYDAITLSNGNTIVLNRGKLIISDQEQKSDSYKKSKLAKVRHTKHNEAYLDEVTNFIKLNYNCPENEKVGTGPGSCGGSKSDRIQRKIQSINDINKVNKILNNIDNYRQKLFARKAINKDPKKITDINNSISSLYDNYEYPLFIRKAQLEFKPPSGPYRNPYENVVKTTEKILSSNKEYEKSMITYVEDSHYITRELLRDPDMVREVVSPSEKSSYITKHKLDDNFSLTYNNVIANMDKIMKSSVLSDKIITYSGLSKDLWDKLPKDANSEFSVPTFISSSADKDVAKGFASFRNPNKDELYFLEIRSKPGTHVIATEQVAIRQHLGGSWTIGEGGVPGGKGSQQELIMNRGQSYKVVGIEQDGNFKKLIVETV